MGKLHVLSHFELDQELGIKTLVSIGGGGGSAYVYIGAWEVLHKAGLIPGFVIGSSMGAGRGPVPCVAEAQRHGRVRGARQEPARRAGLPLFGR
jgi:hypothetical protein